MSIGERLKEFAQIQYGTIKEMSEVFSFNPNLISTYVNNRSVPGGLILSTLAKAGCNINWLLTGEGEMLTNQAITEHKLLCPHCNNPIKITIEKG